MTGIHNVYEGIQRTDWRGHHRRSEVRFPDDPVHLAWATGIVEGEGTFHAEKAKYKSPYVKVAMTDEDIILRLQELFGGTVTGPYQPKGPGVYKLQWVWCQRGPEPMRHMVALMWPLLGDRRKRQAMQMLHDHRIATARRRSQPKYPRTCKRGHVIHSIDGEYVKSDGAKTCLACWEVKK